MYRVLIADDEPIERMVVCRKIQKYFEGQLEVIQAENGREAVERFFSEQCQIALLDIEMPGMNGLEAAEKIREKDLHSSIVFLTAFDEFDYAKRAISLRALDYLLKPGEDKELIAVLEEAIRIEEEHSRLGKDIFPTMQALAAERDAKEDVPENALPERGKMRVVSESILKYIDEHYKEDISLQDVAGMLHYSDAYFCKIFKHCFDKNFIVYLTEYRIEKAKLLLADVVINIKDVSQEVGYRDSNYFTKVFKRMVGVTPSEYRTQILCRQETEEKK